MALTGIEIFKLLAKTNCKECGFPTCLAFAMALASGKAELDKCPSVSDEVREKLAAASAPPIRPVKLPMKDGVKTIGGGQVTPGFVGHSKYNVTQRKFILGDGGLLRVVWMPKILKEELRDRLLARGEEEGIPDLIDRIADETVGVTEDEILPFLTEKTHPALSMEPIIG